MKRIFRRDISTSIIVIIAILFTSCEKFVELGAPPNQVLYEDAFRTDASAQSVVLGLYVSATGNYNIANISSMTTLYSGVSADDLEYNAADANILEFANNGLLNTNGSVASLWSSMFQLIKNTNNAISGLEQSTTLTPVAQDQLIGEAKFLRAYTYFYLVNLFGDVPLSLTDDYNVFENAVLPRTASNLIYQQVIADLLDAEERLSVAYQGTFRARANKHAATSLLARAYLYSGDYENAELCATKVLSSTEYELPEPSATFVNDSKEVIFQLANLNGITTFGFNYVTANTVIPAYSLPERIYNSFETIPNIDLRSTNWLTPKTISGRDYYAISKYKSVSGTGNEYHIVLRLAEQYLIRAESRARQNNLSGAKVDIDAVRTRAGLAGLTDGLTQDEMVLAVEQERLHEFFGEYGHRWLDLKRTNRANEVLSSIKTNWQSTDVLYPIPQSQILLNPALTQNDGYED